MPRYSISGADIPVTRLPAGEETWPGITEFRLWGEGDWTDWAEFEGNDLMWSDIENLAQAVLDDPWTLGDLEIRLTRYGNSVDTPATIQHTWPVTVYGILFESPAEGAQLEIGTLVPWTARIVPEGLVAGGAAIDWIFHCDDTEPSEGEGVEGTDPPDPQQRVFESVLLADNREVTMTVHALVYDPAQSSGWQGMDLNQVIASGLGLVAERVVESLNPPLTVTLSYTECPPIVQTSAVDGSIVAYFPYREDGVFDLTVSDGSVFVQSWFDPLGLPSNWLDLTGGATANHIRGLTAFPDTWTTQAQSLLWVPLVPIPLVLPLPSTVDVEINVVSLSLPSASDVGEPIVATPLPEGTDWPDSDRYIWRAEINEVMATITETGQSTLPWAALDAEGFTEGLVTCTARRAQAPGDDTGQVEIMRRTWVQDEGQLTLEISHSLLGLVDVFQSDVNALYLPAPGVTRCEIIDGAPRNDPEQWRFRGLQSPSPSNPERPIGRIEWRLTDYGDNPMLISPHFADEVYSRAYDIQDSIEFHINYVSLTAEPVQSLSAGITVNPKPSGDNWPTRYIWELHDPQSGTPIGQIETSSGTLDSSTISSEGFGDWEDGSVTCTAVRDGNGGDTPVPISVSVDILALGEVPEHFSVKIEYPLILGQGGLTENEVTHTSIPVTGGSEPSGSISETLEFQSGARLRISILNDMSLSDVAPLFIDRLGSPFDHTLALPEGWEMDASQTDLGAGILSLIPTPGTEFIINCAMERISEPERHISLDVPVRVTVLAPDRCGQTPLTLTQDLPWRITVYNTPYEESFPEASAGAPLCEIYARETDNWGEPIGEPTQIIIRPSAIYPLSVEGFCRLGFWHPGALPGRYIQYDDEHGYLLWSQPVGYCCNPLVPHYSVAPDQRWALGPTGSDPRRHMQIIGLSANNGFPGGDTCVRADDRGGDIEGAHLDFYVGLRAWSNTPCFWPDGTRNPYYDNRMEDIDENRDVHHNPPAL